MSPLSISRPLQGCSPDRTLPSPISNTTEKYSYNGVGSNHQTGRYNFRYQGEYIPETEFLYSPFSCCPSYSTRLPGDLSMWGYVENGDIFVLLLVSTESIGFLDLQLSFLFVDGYVPSLPTTYVKCVPIGVSASFCVGDSLTLIFSVFL